MTALSPGQSPPPVAPRLARRHGRAARGCVSGRPAGDRRTTAPWLGTLEAGAVEAARHAVGIFRRHRARPVRRSQADQAALATSAWSSAVAVVAVLGDRCWPSSAGSPPMLKSRARCRAACRSRRPSGRGTSAAPTGRRPRPPPTATGAPRPKPAPTKRTTPGPTNNRSPDQPTPQALSRRARRPRHRRRHHRRAQPGRVHRRSPPRSSSYREFTQHFPQPGLGRARRRGDLGGASRPPWLDVRRAAGRRPVAAIGITNQRETVVAWDRRTGAAAAPGHRVAGPAHRGALRRAAARPGTCRSCGERTGLVLDPYFSATKIAWLLQPTGGVDRPTPTWRSARSTAGCSGS